MRNLIIIPALVFNIFISSMSAQFEIRDASFEADPSLIEMTLVTSDKRQKVYVDHIPLLTAADIENAFVAQTGTSTYNGKTEKHFGMHVQLTESGAVKFAEITSSRISKQLAILIDGELLSVPTVQAKLSKNFSVTCASKKEAEAFVEKTLKSRDKHRLP